MKVWLNKRLVSLVTVAFLPFLVGCGSIKKMAPEETFSVEPTLATKTSIAKTLESLPAAEKVVTVSVYDFKDYTGQNKPGETAEYSRAVTQGGVSILKKALVDAGQSQWFRVLERGGLEHLLQERKIIRSIRQQYSTSDGRKLPQTSTTSLLRLIA